MYNCIYIYRNYVSMLCFELLKPLQIYVVQKCMVRKPLHIDCSSNTAYIRMAAGFLQTGEKMAERSIRSRRMTTRTR